MVVTLSDREAFIKLLATYCQTMLALFVSFKRATMYSIFVLPQTVARSEINRIIEI